MFLLPHVAAWGEGEKTNATTASGVVVGAWANFAG